MVGVGIMLVIPVCFFEGVLNSLCMVSVLTLATQMFLLLFSLGFGAV